MSIKEEVWCVLGTRPEVIKMAPVIMELQKRDIPHKIIATGQHDSLFEDAMRTFDLQAYANLKLMRPGQPPEEFLGRAIVELSHLIDGNDNTGAILAQGDTSTVLAASIVAFHKRIPFGHVEAGLRTYDLLSPFPEEYNRRVVALGTKWHFAPTSGAYYNLIQESLRPGDMSQDVYKTGNTIVDTLKYITDKYGAVDPEKGRPFKSDYVFVTCHRRENFGEPMERVFEAIKQLAAEFEDMTFWYPLHPNPAVAKPANDALGHLSNVILSSALTYVDCVRAINGARLVITDSGGVQEEAVSLGIPTLVTRESTERPEGVVLGGCTLVGTDTAEIIGVAQALLMCPEIYAKHKVPHDKNPYGDGKAAERIVAVLKKYFEEKRDAKI